MTAVVSSITEDDLYTAIRSFIIGITGGEVVNGNVNRVADPVGDFAVITSMRIAPLSTNKTSYSNANNIGAAANSTSTEWRCQVDVYGPNSGTNALAISNLVRTSYACDVFAASGVDMQPLYASEPSNMAMINAAQQYEGRWMFDFIAQFNPVLTVPTDFATALDVNLVEVDTTYR